ncbi:MAG: radical SAM protein, partial [Synergistaceae bacterium]|nr:radical SAM protein [Synergistaceae bacterium]
MFYPADYSVGMSNLGYHYIYRKLRELGVSSERFFAGPVPHRSVENDTLLERFQMILAGVSYEGDVPCLARWLLRGGIDPSRRRRADGDPIVGSGGAISYINPLSLCGICDFIVLGDGLPVMPFVVDALRGSGSRTSLLGRLAEHGSILVPGIHLDG